MNRVMLTVIATALTGALTIPARAQVKTPPSWETLVRCADMTDVNKQVECYNAAMREAGYVRSPQVAAAERHKTFGLTLPNLHKAKPPETAVAQQSGAPGAAPSPAPAEDENRITVHIVEVAYTQPLNKLMIVTSDGGVWEQVDTIPLTFTPKAGQAIEIRKTRFGGFFCQFDRTNAVRCVRKN